MPIAMIVSRFNVMSMVPKPGCGLESECGTVIFIVACLRAHFGAPPYFKSCIHPCSKTLPPVVLSINPSSSTPPPPPSPIRCTSSPKKNPLPISAFHFSFSFQLFSFLFHPFPVTPPGPAKTSLWLDFPASSHTVASWWWLHSRGFEHSDVEGNTLECSRKLATMFGDAGKSNHREGFAGPGAGDMKLYFSAPSS